MFLIPMSPLALKLQPLILKTPMEPPLAEPTTLLLVAFTKPTKHGFFEAYLYILSLNLKGIFFTSLTPSYRQIYLIWRAERTVLGKIGCFVLRIVDISFSSTFLLTHLTIRIESDLPRFSLKFDPACFTTTPWKIKNLTHHLQPNRVVA